MPRPSALSINASDPSGGLLAADLLAFEALGAAGAAVVTAATARGLREEGPVHDVPVAQLRASLAAAVEARRPAAAKLGVVTAVPAARALARDLGPLGIPVVVDPGFAPASGLRLVRPTVLDVLVRELLPSAALATLSVPEASVLAGFPIRGEADAKAAARRIQALGPSAVLVTGGCVEGPTVVDGLLDGRTWHRFEAPRLETPPACGAGGLLSAAVTAWLALGETLPEAVSRALGFVRRALAAGWPDAPLPR